MASGFALVRKGETYVITNAHVLEQVQDPGKFYADFGPPMKAHAVKILARDSTDDLAVLATNVEIHVGAEEHVKEPRVNTTVFIVGFDDEHTTRDRLNIESGAIEEVGFWMEEKHMFILSGTYSGSAAPAMLISGVTCRLGGSGSPVFDLQGDILGVVKGFSDDGKCLAIDILPVRRLLEKYSQ